MLMALHPRSCSQHHLKSALCRRMSHLQELVRRGRCTQTALPFLQHLLGTMSLSRGCGQTVLSSVCPDTHRPSFYWDPLGLCSGDSWRAFPCKTWGMSLGMTLLRSADVKNIYPESGWEITEVCLGYREPFPVVRNRDFSLLVEKQKLGEKKKIAYLAP